MYSGSLFVLALAVFGASAQNLVSSGCGLGFNNLNTVNTFNTGCGSSIATAPIIENVPIRIPGFVHPTSVQDTCNCVKTVVRPTMRKEIFTIPSVQRFVQTTSTPVVETVPYVRSSAVDVPTVGVESVGVVPSVGVSTVGVPAFGGVVSGINGGFGGFSGINGGFGGVVSGLNNGIVGTGINGVVGTGINGVVGTGFGVAC